VTLSDTSFRLPAGDADVLKHVGVLTNIIVSVMAAYYTDITLTMSVRRLYLH